MHTSPVKGNRKISCQSLEMKLLSHFPKVPPAILWGGGGGNSVELEKPGVGVHGSKFIALRPLFFFSLFEIEIRAAVFCFEFICAGGGGRITSVNVNYCRFSGL